MSSINIKKRKKIRASGKIWSYLYSIIKNTKHMKKFKVTETIPATVEYTYYVEAENEEQALDIVMNGDAEETATMRWVEEGDGEWEVEEEKEK